MSDIKGRIGALLHASNMGLGILGRALYDNGIIDHVLIQPIKRHSVHRSWYANAPMATASEFKAFISNIDALLIVETVSDWDVVEMAKQRGIPVAMMPMYEWSPMPAPVRPDRYLCPSLLDLDYYRDLGPARFLPVPVEVPWRQRRRARIFVHNAGNAECAERNGTAELLRAITKVKSDARFLIRIQHSKRNARNQDKLQTSMGELLEQAIRNPRVEFSYQTVPFEDLWKKGDVFVFPEKYNGLSLPLQEAYACGMLVMGGNRYPANTWLPNDPLIPVHGYEPRKIKVDLESAVYHPETISDHIDRWYDRDIQTFSDSGRAWAEEHSWKRLRESYRKFILLGD
jgi:hypothetical protein